MLLQIGDLVLTLAFGLVMVALVARLLGQIARADFYNPVGQTVLSVTNPLVLPLRRVLPTIGGLDNASLLWLCLSQLLFACLLTLLQGQSPLPFLGPFLVGSFLGSAAFLLNVLLWSMVIVALASWLSSGYPNPMLAFVAQMIEPFVAPVRRLRLHIGMLDLSFLVALLVLQIGGILLRGLAVQLGLPTQLFLGL